MSNSFVTCRVCDVETPYRGYGRPPVFCSRDCEKAEQRRIYRLGCDLMAQQKVS